MFELLKLFNLNNYFLSGLFGGGGGGGDNTTNTTDSSNNNNNELRSRQDLKNSNDIGIDNKVSFNFEELAKAQDNKTALERDKFNYQKENNKKLFDMKSQLLEEQNAMNRANISTNNTIRIGELRAKEEGILSSNSRFKKMYSLSILSLTVTIAIFIYKEIKK